MQRCRVLGKFASLSSWAQGINALVKLLQPSKGSPADLHLAETVAVAITILSINNELNQDAVRYDIPASLLESHLRPR